MIRVTTNGPIHEAKADERQARAGVLARAPWSNPDLRHVPGGVPVQCGRLRQESRSYLCKVWFAGKLECGR